MVIGDVLRNFFCRYSTPKLVVIRDAKLVTVNVILKLSVLLYVIIWTFCYNCDHLVYEPIVGFSRLTLWEPTKKCDPRTLNCHDNLKDLSELPYCKEYAGVVTNPLIEQFPCIYKDGFQLTAPRPSIDSMFVPTMKNAKRGTMQCPKGTLSCDKVVAISEANFTGHYIADIESFTVMISHHTERLTNADCPKIMRENSKGYLRPSTGEHIPFPNFFSGSTNDPVPPEYPSAEGIKFGDILSLGDLVKLSNPSKGTDLDNFHTIYSSGLKDRSRRRSGGVLRVNIEYSNFGHWYPLANGPHQYFVSTVFAPYDHMTEVTYNLEEDDVNQVLREDIGIVLNVRVYGRHYNFSWWQFFKMVSSVVALLLAATILVDWVMQYSCHPRSRHYARLKRQQPPGYSEKRRTGTELLHKLTKKMQAPTDLELLAILVKFEERLDHLDGLNIREEDHSSDEESEYEDVEVKEATLNSIYIFRHLSETNMRLLAQSMEGSHYEQDDIVIQQGSVGTDLFIIAHGEVEVSIDGNVVETKSKNSYFGERALLSHAPRTATVKVLSDSAYIWNIDSRAIRRIMDDDMIASLKEEMDVQERIKGAKDLQTVAAIRTFSSRRAALLNDEEQPTPLE